MLKTIIRNIRKGLKKLLELLQNEKVDKIEITFVTQTLQTALSALPISNTISTRHYEAIAKEIVKGLNKINDKTQKLLEKRIENEK